MEKVPSNPMSDYDFAEEPEEIVEQGDIMHNLAIQKMDPNLLMVLNSYQLENEVLERFAASGIKFSQLAGLINEDLAMLGVHDEKLQDEMLRDFRNLEGQDPYLELALRNLHDPKKAAKHEMSVIDLINNQLHHMNTLLAATILKIGSTQTAQSPGVVVNSNFNSPQLVLDMLQKMTSHANEMTELIRQLKDQREMNKRKKQMNKESMKSFALKSLLIVSGVFVGFLIAKNRSIL